ncbi:MAG: DUF262 domain-containing protein [Oscillospiraceae bacterium]|nr:DUF262 domain-containing protein [Oscillospiraceae bacterium]
MRTESRQLTELMKNIEQGKSQLPDFQRGWVWDDNRIISLIASITNGYPVGAAMFLEYGNENIRLKYRQIEGAPKTDAVPDELILDGQQRLTSIYASLYSSHPVNTKTEKGQEILRYYYIDIADALDSSKDRSDAIISVPASRIVTSDFGRKIDLDISTKEKEYEQKKFPLNIILDFIKTSQWIQGYQQYYHYTPEIMDQIIRFQNEITNKTMNYQIPIIVLDEDTPKEAVCQVFENVNTGGVSLTVFELITAIFAMDDFALRKDWDSRRDKYFDGDILSSITATDFLTACTLLTSYQKGGTVSCKKKDVLALTLDDYKQYADELSKGVVEAEELLQQERIFSANDLPYTTQLIPLAVLCTLLAQNNLVNVTNVRDKLRQWYWCGVFGELYGGANETRYVNDVVGVMEWISDSEKVPKTVQESYFNPLRLLTMQSRQSAAYKGVMALILKNHCRDFISGSEMDFTRYKAEHIDIHHVFPKKYCIDKKYLKEKWNSIVNKTPLSYSTNREIGGVAPSEY